MPPLTLASGLMNSMSEWNTFHVPLNHHIWTLPSLRKQISTPWKLSQKRSNNAKKFETSLNDLMCLWADELFGVFFVPPHVSKRGIWWKQRTEVVLMHSSWLWQQDRNWQNCTPDIHQHPNAWLAYSIYMLSDTVHQKYKFSWHEIKQTLRAFIFKKQKTPLHLLQKRWQAKTKLNWITET